MPGDRLRTIKDEGLKDFVLDQLHDLGALQCRAMFGGFGLSQGADFFGIIYRGRLYFRTDARSRAAYVEHGMTAFRPNARQSLTRYYEVPVDIVEDSERLTLWARTAMAAQKTGTHAPRSRRR